jgi:DNA-binding transcriptional LysR family regulator
MPPLSRHLTQLGSGMKLSWSLPDYGRYAEDLAKGHVDLALIPKMTQVTGVQSQLLCEDAYVCAARVGHPVLAGGVTLERFCAYPHVVLGQTRSMLDDTIDGTLTRLGQRRHVQAAVASFSQMVDLLDTTDLIAVFPQRVAQRYTGVLGDGPLPFELPNYRLYLCWHQRSETDPAFQWFKAQVLATAELAL